jgi:hypothetical protein
MFSFLLFSRLACGNVLILMVRLQKKKRFKTCTQEGFSCTNYVVYLLWSSLWQFKQEDDAEKAMQDAKAAMRIQVTAEVRIAQERSKLDRERVNVCV